MAGDPSKHGSRGTRPLRIRPHWWAVLAVSLSLLALVAAATSGQQGGPGRHRSATPPSRDRHATSPTTTASTTTTLPGSGSRSGPVIPSTSPVVTTPFATGAETTKAQIAVRQSIALPSTPPPTTTTTTAPSGATVVTAPPPLPAYIRTGDLQYPDLSTANFVFEGSGTMQITATWPTTPTVSLTVTCQGVTHSASGSSSVTVLFPGTDGLCTATLEELQVQYDAVTYKFMAVQAGG